MTQEKFESLTWSEIKTYSADCVTNKSKYIDWLGLKKSFQYDISVADKSGTMNAVLVALNNGKSSSNSTIGFTFMVEQGWTTTSFYPYSFACTYEESTARKLCMEGSRGNSGLQTYGFYEFVLDPLKSNITSSKIYAASSNATMSSSDIATAYTIDPIFIPSYYELGQGDTYGKEGTPFDYFVANPENVYNFGIQNLYEQNDSSPSYWLRTPYQAGTNYYHFRTVIFSNDNKKISYTQNNSSASRLCVCFCI